VIANDLELRRTRDQLEQLEAALGDLKRRVYPLSPGRFRLMSESYLSEIEMLRGRIEEYLGIKAAREVSSDLILKIQSPLLPEGIAPAQVLNRAIAGLQRGLQSLGRFVARATYGLGEGISSYKLGQEFGLDVVALMPGSFEVGLRMSSAGKLDIPRGSFDEVIQKFGLAAAHVSEGDVTQELLSELVPDLNSQLQVLQALKDISPSQRQGDLTVSFSARSMGHRPAVFSPRTRSYITSLIRSTSRHAREIGVIREVDLDRRTFKLRTSAATLRCKLRGGTDDMMIGALGQRARVSGVVRIAPDGSITSFLADRLDIV
jgi:hypothetical protein